MGRGEIGNVLPVYLCSLLGKGKRRRWKGEREILVVEATVRSDSEIMVLAAL